MGALTALALPPVHAVSLLFIAFPVLVWLIDRSRRLWAAFGAGWWFGLGFFVAGLYWIANALLTDPVKFGWMLPFALGGLGGGLALFPAVAAAIAWLVRGRGASRILAFAIAWTGMEYVRGFAFTGFPWNLIGYSWAFSDEMNQFAALSGIWGLSLLTALGAAAPALLAGRPSAAPEAQPARDPARRWGTVALFLLPLLGVLAFGAVRLAGAEVGTVPGVRLRLVQAAIEQRHKAQADLLQANIARHLHLSVDSPGYDSITTLIWPETAFPFLLERYPLWRQALGQAAPPGGLLITGAVRAEPDTGPYNAIWNSLEAIAPDGRIVGTADKFHLVPFGEYVPFARYLPFIQKITPGLLDFSAGPGPRTLHLPGLPPVGPLICYEVIFPGQVLDRHDRPRWLLNLTNDGWYGMSTGPYQHFAAARLRAVEEGLPLIRVANTGISASIDPYGRVVRSLHLGRSGVLDVDLPEPITGLTPYARFGDWTFFVLLAVVAAAGATLRLREGLRRA
ncbi:MAG: apolipoprotein N-acyltransferase, partial [Rhodospirillaceae bacterium]|nr:apolipoprotein N-acyltransferase [Rhodospirillaceae bacterium]